LITPAFCQRRLRCRFRQVHPRSDGVILVLRTPHHRSVYSILRPRFGLQPTGRTLLPWRHHPEAATIGGALADGRLYLGSTGPARPRTRTTSSARLDQMTRPPTVSRSCCELRITLLTL
jgi:hypothetical protein